MIRKVWLTVLLLAVAGIAGANSLEPPAGPASADSAMFTLDDIYNKLDTRAVVTKRAGAFAEPAGEPLAPTSRTLDDILSLTTQRAPVRVSGQRTSYAVTDDAFCSTNFGVSWPVPRFTIGTNSPGQPNDTNCVTDNLTGLMWARDANLLGVSTWSNALASIAALEHGGYDDWRMPTLNELMSLIDFGSDSPAICNTAGSGKCVNNDPFTSLTSLGNYYWTSTTAADNPANAASCTPSSGGQASSDKGATSLVWPVRGGGK